VVEMSDRYRQIAEALIAIPRFLSREKIRQFGPEGIASIVESIANGPDDHTLNLVDDPGGLRCNVCGLVKHEMYFGDHQNGAELSQRVCRYCCWRIRTKADELYRQQRRLPPKPQRVEMLSRLNPEQSESLKTFLAYRAVNPPGNNEPRIKLPANAYRVLGFYGPGFANFSSGCYRTTEDEPYSTERREILSWWTSTHDAVVEWFLRSYGMFAQAALGGIELEIKRLRGVRGDLARHFWRFLLDRINTKAHLWNLYASDFGARYRRGHSCRACGKRERLINLHPDNVEATFGRVLPLCDLHWKTYRRTVREGQLYEGPFLAGLTDLDSVLGDHLCPVCNQTHSWRDHASTYTLGFYGIPERYREICFSCLDTAINRQPRSYTTKQDLAGVLEISQLLCELPDHKMFEVVTRQAGSGEVAAAIVRCMQSMVRFDTLKREYGSWFAVLARAGCLPEGCRRETFGTRILAKDGHECLSLAEMTIDDALHRLNIPHRKEVRYPNAGFVCDWVITRGDAFVFIEYFGLAGQESYNEKILQKRLALSKAGLELVEFYDEDLERIEERLSEFAPARAGSATNQSST